MIARLAGKTLLARALPHPADDVARGSAGGDAHLPVADPADKPLSASAHFARRTIRSEAGLIGGGSASAG